MGVSGFLRDLRRQLEKTVDWVIAKVDEGLKSFGSAFEQADFVVVKRIHSTRAQPALKSTVIAQGLVPHNKAHHAFNRQKDPYPNQVKCTFQDWPRRFLLLVKARLREWVKRAQMRVKQTLAPLSTVVLQQPLMSWMYVW